MPEISAGFGLVTVPDGASGGFEGVNSNETGAGRTDPRS